MHTVVKYFLFSPRAVDKLKRPETSQMENGNLMLYSSLPDDIILSKFIDTINVTVKFEPAQVNCENRSYTAELNNQTLNFVINRTDSCIPQESFRVKVKAPFTNNFSELSDTIGKLSCLCITQFYLLFLKAVFTSHFGISFCDNEMN